MREALHKATNAQRQLMTREPNALLSLVRKIISDDEEDEIKAYLFEKPEDRNVVTYCRYNKKRFPMLYKLAKDILAIPAMSAPVESFFSILGDVIMKKRNRLFPATTKMLAVVKDMVRKIRPDDEDSGMKSDDDNAGDDVELNDMISKEIDDVSRDQMEVDIAEAIEINWGRGLFDD